MTPWAAMEITATFRSTPKQVWRSYRACHRTSYILSWVLAVAFSLFGILSRDLFPVLVSVIYLGVNQLMIRRQLKTHLTGEQTITLTMTDDEYRVRCLELERGTSRTWTTFSKVLRAGEFWVLRVAPRGSMAFPASALDDAQTAAFEHLMRAKGLLPAGDVPAA